MTTPYVHESTSISLALTLFETGLLSVVSRALIDEAQAPAAAAAATTSTAALCSLRLPPLVRLLPVLLSGFFLFPLVPPYQRRRWCRS